MLAATHPENDQRLHVLRSFDVLDTAPEKAYDDITQLTAELCEAPICMVTLVEEDRQWFKSTVGLGRLCETPLEQSLCTHAVAQDSYLEIEDTLLDERSKDNPLCHGNPPIRFYAGAILRTFDGWPLGTLCVLDVKPRKLTALQKRVLQVNAKSVTQLLELTRALIKETKSSAHLSVASVPTEYAALYKKVSARYATLTPREKEVVDLIASDTGILSSKEIARHLGISHRTVDHHRASIMKKMKVDSVAELIAVILKSGILQPTG
ncbi:MAG: GAF domain-containing protein [Acidimicrobiales bacterium]|nr:hypothetical protein [Hyphomonadaceae bacterium]RZV44722.1 MAG: GAF domain-containing protein [Acidimicrobiales bacterium]